MIKMYKNSLTIILVLLLSSPIFAQQKTSSDANEVAKFLAGKTSTKYANLQKKSWYKTHKKAVNTGWNKYTKATLSEINDWNSGAQISEETDNNTLFYPFSGPDFLYANAFFPDCKNYIMLGLEEPGSLPNLNSIPDSTIEKYLINVRKSLRYINKTGYFVTKHMLSQFSDLNLDGTLHVLLYYLAMSDCEVFATEQVYIDKKSKIRVYSTDPGKRFLKGTKITFKKAGDKRVKTVYYFRVNADNANMKLRPEFLQFVGSFGRFITYMKSASYLMHNKEFATIRNFTLRYSYKIFQDDSGIDYSDLNEKFDIQLFGTYSKTIKDFDYLFQEDLKVALANEKRPKKLPFKIGYNRWHNETVLMYGKYNPNKKIVATTDTDAVIVKKKVTNGTNGNKKKTESFAEYKPNKKDKVIFKVQIKMTSIPIHDKNYFKKLSYKTEYYKESGKYKYTIGNVSSYTECAKFKEAAKKAGFNGAFTIAFYKGKRIDIKQAIELSK